MRKIIVKKFELSTIADALSGLDLQSARTSLLFAIGALLDVSGTVQKVVKRDGQMKLVIESDAPHNFVVFTNCLSDAQAEIVRISKIRKGSSVSIRGRLSAFGRRAVCLSECCLK